MAEGSTRHYTEWTPRHILRSRYEYEDESKETSSIMSLLGYGPVIRQKRIEAWTEWDRMFNANAYVEIYTAGSKSEGLTCICESDTDAIIVIPNAVCVEDGVDVVTIPGHIQVFNMNMQSCNAGYCRPLVVRYALFCHPAISLSLFDDEHGCTLLSSTSFVDCLKNYMPKIPLMVNHARVGPSLPWSFGPFQNDNVGAIYCNCPNILHKWASRVRHWPPPDIVEKVIAMRAFITAIGFKGSRYNHFEWRICFNTAETVLVNNLNDTQVKIYVILKMIVKEVLKPQKKEITSYLLKNIVLWLAENNPQALFHSGRLFYWLHEGLDKIRTATSVSQLPYYMIPERNLMAERGIEAEKQIVFVRLITDMMDEGPRMLLRLKKIRQAIICHPEPLLWYSKKKTELEMVHLEYVKRRLHCKDMEFMDNETYDILTACHKRSLAILLEVLCRMRLEGSLVNDTGMVDVMMLS